jgi:O-antigen/teichoic acid export membrane protein
VGLRKAGDSVRVKSELRNLMTITLVYCAGAALALALLAEPLLGWILPRYVADLHWVYLLTPGLIASTLSTPFALIFNVVIDYRWYVIAYGAGVAATLLAFGGALVLGRTFSLDGVIVLRSAIYGLMAALVVIGWWRLSARHREFRFIAG